MYLLGPFSIDKPFMEGESNPRDCPRRIPPTRRLVEFDWPLEQRICCDRDPDPYQLD